MDWTPGGPSQDLEDRRGSSGGGFGIGGGGLGIGGVIILLILSVITGRNFFSGSAPSARVDQPGGPAGQSFSGEDRDVQLVSFVLDDVQQTWTKIFAEHGRQYRHAKLVLYRDLTYSGCGTAQQA